MQPPPPEATGSLTGTTDAPIEVMSTLGVYGPLSTRIAPAFEAASGLRLQVRYDPTGVLMRAIAAGARADVLIAIAGGVEGLAREGVIEPSSIAPVAASRVGLAKRPGLPPVDISTPGRLAATLVAARAVAFSASGASGLFFAGLIERLGIAAEVRARAVIIPDGFTAACLASGQADLAVQQISELMAVPGTEVVGAFPEPCQEVSRFVAAVFGGSARAAAARAFIVALRGPEATAALAEAGLDPPGA